MLILVSPYYSEHRSRSKYLQKQEHHEVEVFKHGEKWSGAPVYTIFIFAGVQVESPWLKKIRPNLDQHNYTCKFIKYQDKRNPSDTGAFIKA